MKTCLNLGADERPADIFSRHAFRISHVTWSSLACYYPGYRENGCQHKRGRFGQIKGFYTPNTLIMQFSFLLIWNLIDYGSRKVGRYWYNRAPPGKIKGWLYYRPQHRFLSFLLRHSVCQHHTKCRVGGRMLPPGQNAATPNALVREIDQSRLRMHLSTRDNFLFLKFGTGVD